MKFKIGDKVRCIKRHGEGKGAGWEEGLEFTIKSITDEGSADPIYWEAKNENGVYESCLELVDTIAKRFKVGDEVRIIKKFSKNNSASNISVNAKGYISDIIKDDISTAYRPERCSGNDYYLVRSDNDNGWFDPEELELISVVTSHIRKVIIKCPTKKDWVAVVKQAIRDGCNEKDDWDQWTVHGEKSCIRITEDGFLNYGTEDIAYTPVDYQDHIHLTAQEYLNKFKQTSDEKPNKQRKKIMMSIIKNIFKTKEQKALSYYGLTNGDGGLTNEGRSEFMDYIWETDKEAKKEFITRIVEQYEEDKKRR